MTLSAIQVKQLLQPINSNRVLRDGKGHSHVSQQDVLAHLIRVFGFGNFDIDVCNVALVFEHQRLNDKQEPSNRWDVCYRAMVRLTIRDAAGAEIAHYENGSTATAQNQTLGDAHDLAYKSAISLSVKRATIALGDQFGLSLYNKGQMTALVRGTLVEPPQDDEKADDKHDDVQDGVPQQVSLGNDETAYEGGDAAAPAEQPAQGQQQPPQLQGQPKTGGGAVPDESVASGPTAPPPGDEAPKKAQALADTATRVRTISSLRALYEQAQKAGLLGEEVADNTTGELDTLVRHIARHRTRVEALMAEAS